MENISYTAKDVEKFWRNVARRSSSECWLWQAGCNEKGYGLLNVERRTVKAHRFSYLITFGAIGNLHVLHHCDNPPCVNPGHLFLGTHSDNMADKYRKGRSNHARGSATGAAKLNESQVRQIRAEYGALKTGKKLPNGAFAALAARYGVDKSTIGYIVRGANWRHV